MWLHRVLIIASCLHVYFPFIFRLLPSVGWYIVVRPFDIGRGIFFRVIFTDTKWYVWFELSVCFTISSCPHGVSTILEWMSLFIFFLLANFVGRVGRGGELDFVFNLFLNDKIFFNVFCSHLYDNPRLIYFLPNILYSIYYFTTSFWTRSKLFFSKPILFV